MSQKCLQFIKKRVKGISDEDAQELADSVNALTTRFQRENGLPFEDAQRNSVEELTNRFIHIQRIEKRNRSKNRLMRMRAYKQIKTNFEDDPGKGIEAMLVGLETGRAGARASAAAAFEMARDHAVMAFSSDLQRAGLLKVFNNRAFEKQIVEVARLLDEGQSTKVYDPEVVETVKIIQKHTEKMRIEANAAGADIGKIDGWLFTRSHDAHRINKATKDGWTAFLTDRLDWNKTFPDATDAQRADILGSLYTQFATGKHTTSIDPEMTGFKGVGNVGKSMSHSRVLHFKSPEAEFEYHQEFGYASVADSIVSSLSMNAGKTAMMRQLGPNARSNFDAVTDMLANEYKAKDTEAYSRIIKAKEQAERLYWPYLDGSGNAPGSKTAANFFGIVRGIEIMSKLGQAVISAFSDPTFHAAEVARQGGGFLPGIADAVGATFKGVSKDEAHLLAEMGIAVDGLIGGTVSRISSEDPTPGKMSKMLQTYFKLNLLQPWTDRQRRAFSLGMSHRLALATEKGLGEEMKGILSLYNIGEAEWNLIRQSQLETVNNKSFLSPEHVSTLSDEAVSGYLRDQGQKPTKTAINEVRSRLSESLRVAYSDRVDHAVIQGDIKTRGMMLQGTRPGTLAGEALRSVMLFKTFSAAVLQKAVGAEFFGRTSATTWGGAARQAWSSGAVAGIARMFVTATALGYVSMALKDMAKGRKPRDPMSGKTWSAAALQGGALGIYGDFLFGDMRNRFGGGPIETLAGPVAGTAASLTDLINRAARGEDAASETLAFAKNHLPGTFYTKLPLDYLIMWELSERINPGYTRRMERRIKSENDQEYFPVVAPTAAVR